MDTKLGLIFPMVTMHALERIESLSDHATIILNSNSTSYPTVNAHSNLNWDGYIGMALQI